METDELREFYKSRIQKLKAQGRDELATLFETEMKMSTLEKRVVKALQKAIGKIGTEYLPSSEMEEQANSYPAGFPESDVLLSHIRSGGVKSTVAPMLTKSVRDLALRQLGVQTKPRTTAPKTQRVMTLSDINFRR